MMNNKEIYFTDDHAFAAYLCLRGYTLLGAVDDNTPGPFSNIMKFAVTHAVLRHDSADMNEDILNKMTEYNSTFALPFDKDMRHVSFREFNIKLRMCKKALAYPVKIEALAVQ